MTDLGEIRVLVAEDSSTARALIVGILGSDLGIEVAGEARNGVEAVEMTARLKPGVVTMDIRMPLMDGLEATKRIMAFTPTPIMIVSGSLDVREVEVSMNAIKAGALTVIRKPAGPGFPGFEEEAGRFVETVKAMAGVKVVRRLAESRRPDSAPPADPGVRVRIVAVAASTGGPAALQRLLAGLPGDFPVPILIVQHIAAGFISGLASWLNQDCPLTVKLAENGEKSVAGTVYLAPDGFHLGVAEGDRLVLPDTSPVEGFRPSATLMFESVARIRGSKAVAVVLTGMGRDGVTGLKPLKKAGGRIFAQDEATSVVYGMPKAAADEGLVNAVLPLDSIPSALLDWVSG